MTDATATSGDVTGALDERGLPLLRPFRDRDFRLLWAGQVAISELGDQFYFIALAWLVLQLTGSGLALGSVLIAAAIPRGILMIVGGAVTDRASPRAIILVSNVLRGVVVAWIAALVLLGSIQLWHLVVLGVIFGALDAFFLPAISTLLPMLVPTERLPAANGLFRATSQLTGLVGPAIAGVAIAAIHTGPAFAIDAASFAVAALAVLVIRGGRRARVRSAPGSGERSGAAPEAAVAGAMGGRGTGTAPTSILETIRAGAAYTFSDPAIRTVLILATVLNFAIEGPISVGLPWLAAHRFEGGAAALGFVFASFGAGALPGALLAGSLKQPRRLGPPLFAVAIAIGVGCALLGLAPALPVEMALLAALGLVIGWVNVTAISWMQARVEPAMRGRVMSLTTLGSVGLAPVSLAIAGALVDSWATAMFVAAGSLIVVVMVVAVAAGGMRAIDGPG